jgi:hypothetical protein
VDRRLQDTISEAAALETPVKITLITNTKVPLPKETAAR